MYDLAIVMPVYNEAACINDVLRDWIRELDTLGIAYRLIVLNDGSRDATAEVLKAHAENAKIQIINKANSGHGPTIVQGYRLAVEQAGWIFQVDSDNEIAAQHFKTVWAAREGRDAVIGTRDGRQQPLSRKLVTFFSRMVVNLFYGFGIPDVNCPFRLIRADVLRQLLQHIPANTFAPNVAIAGLLVYRKKQICNIPVPHSDRKTGEVSIKKWKLLQAAIKSCLQTVSIRLSL